MPTIKQFSSPVLITDYLDLEIKSEVDSVSSKKAQTMSLSIGVSTPPKLSITWGSDGSGGRRRNISVEGVDAGYLSDNVGITIKSRTNIDYTLVDGLENQPTVPKFIASIVSSTNLEYLSDGVSATLAHIPSGSGDSAPFDDFFQSTLSGEGSNIYLYDGATFDFLDVDFAPVIQARANASFPKNFFLNAHGTDVNPATIPTGSWDYMADYNPMTPTIIDGVSFNRKFDVIDNVAGIATSRYFTDGYWANLLDSIEIWFYSVDGGAMHVFTEDIEADEYILGQVQYGARNIILSSKSFVNKNKPLRDMSIRKTNPYYPARYIKTN